MPELLLVVSIIGVISALSYPVVRNFSSANTLAEARSKAESLTVAKILFYRTDPIAESKWEAAASEEDQFELIKEYLYHAEEASSLEEYAAAAPYDEFELGDGVRDPVGVAGFSIINNGHGNNEDGVDVSNPGQGHGGPNGEEDPSGDVDDEMNTGNGSDDDDDG